MTGVEILSQEVICNTILPGWCAALGGLLGVICVILLINRCENGFNVVAGVLFVLLLIGVILFILGLIDNENSIDHIEYKVTISDEVSLTEFNEKYEIIDQDGKIYTVKERSE